ncbi:MAG: formylglycine-generating enzyme family protein [Candidatus Hinthialibacter antarcticus]|nr:formylglycine-generating enzyme family protein [Candidatus Hinthialibacter antarcticus]
MKLHTLLFVIFAAFCAPHSFCQPASEFIVPLNVPDGAVSMRMVLVPGGEFHADLNASTVMPQFYIGAYEVTQAQWQAVMGEANNSFYPGEDRPMELSFNDAQQFVEKLNTLGLGEFRLPWEIEWEYAARAETASLFWFGDEMDCSLDGTSYCEWFDRFMWWAGNFRVGTQINLGSKDVGQKEANAWGLYDIHGNMSEWCLDGRIEPADPEVADDEATPLRVLKGGSWGDAAGECAIASRSELPEGFRSPALGVRLVLITSELTNISDWEQY